MQSKNKKAPSAEEQAHIEWIKSQECIVCGTPGPSDAHEVEQGAWFTSLPLCKSCHQGDHNGIHGRKHMWKVMGLDELGALNELVRKLARLAHKH